MRAKWQIRVDMTISIQSTFGNNGRTYAKNSTHQVNRTNRNSRSTVVFASFDSTWR